MYSPTRFYRKMVFHHVFSFSGFHGMGFQTLRSQPLLPQKPRDVRCQTPPRRFASGPTFRFGADERAIRDTGDPLCLGSLLCPVGHSAAPRRGLATTGRLGCTVRGEEAERGVFSDVVFL